MIPIKVYQYESVVKNFTIYAPLKHGTRWLQGTHCISDTTLNTHTSKDKNKLKDSLFENEDNPFGNSKIKLQKFKRKLKVINPVFVYRDPYECFIKAIMTGLGILNNSWKGDPNDLDMVMTGNQHFSPTLWQDILELLELLDNGSVQFVELRKLSKFIRINTLKNHSYNYNDYSFENDIPYGHTKESIIELCKEYHPILWNNFMIQIEKETEALNKLIEKFEWDGK